MDSRTLFPTVSSFVSACTGKVQVVDKLYYVCRVFDTVCIHA